MSARNSVVSLSSNGSGSRVETRLADRMSVTSRTSGGQEGAMLPSSSSKDDDDLLSTSSDEVETMAMQTLSQFEENKSIISGKSDDTDDEDLKKSNEKEPEDKDAEAQQPEANIQNEFGVCGWILTILSYLLIFVTLPISACMCIKVVQEYERAVIFRLGRLMPGGAKGPGIFLIVPCIDTYRKVDLRVLSFEVPPQEILSKDSVTVAVDAVVYFRISNATISVTNVEDAARSTKLLAQTTLRNILGTKTLAEMLSDREAISHQMQTTLDEATEPWGVKVERVEVKDVRLPVQLQRAMAAEAEAAREARAKVIVAEGEQKASRALKEAAEVIAQSPSAIQLRYLQTLNSISAEKNSTIIFPFPIDLLSAFLQRPAPKIEEPPPLPKKIRSCCLYKYPDWVQGMVGEGRPPVSGGQHQHQHFPSHHQASSGPSTTTTSGRPPLPHSMREAQHLSGVASQLPHQTTSNSPSQLDPGSLYDTSRRGGNNARPANGRSGGANSLLKQAIANRLKPNAEQAAQIGASRGTDSVEDRKSEDSMTKSIVMNPAWYRDHEGRTGYKTKEWEDVPNLQKNQVKSRQRQGGDPSLDANESAEPETWSTNDETEQKRDELEDSAARAKSERRKRRSKSKDTSDRLDEALATLEKAMTENIEPELEVESSGEKDKKKMSKDEKKALKEREKEEKKEKEDREKESKRLAKEEKKKEKEREKEEKKQQKMDKKNKSQTSLSKVEEDAESAKKKEKSPSSSKPSTKEEETKLASEKETIKQKKKRSKSEEKAGSSTNEGKDEKKKKERSSSSDNRECKDDLKGASNKQDKEKKGKLKIPDKATSTEYQPSTKQTKPAVVRQPSNESVASSTRSTNTVREVSVASPKTHRKPPTGRPSLNSPQTSTSSPEDEKATSGRTLSKDRRPKKETIGERRDSSVSESSRISAVSHKSVTFCDQIQTHEIERLEFSSSDDDVAVMSDDEMSKPDSNKRRHFSHLIQKRQMEDMNRPQSLSVYNGDDDDFEDQEHLIDQMLKLEQIPQGYPIYNLENSNEHTFYAEDEHADEEGSYISLDHLPATVRQAILAEMRPQDIRDMDCLPMGSMTKLHDPGSSTPSLLSYPPPLPRSASGYLEQDDELMNRSYQQAMYGTAFHHSTPDANHHSVPQSNSQQESSSEFERQRRLQESFYDNVHAMNNSKTGSLLAPSHSSSHSTTDRRSSDTVAMLNSSLNNSPRTDITKRSNTSLDRASFFEPDSLTARNTNQQTSQQTPTPSPPRVVAAPPPQRLVVTSTTTATTTNRTEIVEKVERTKKNEDAMKKQFLAKFGSRRAPIAEEDPTDPFHSMGSQESVLSTDSRESVVSAASIKTETTVRRNFNY